MNEQYAIYIIIAGLVVAAVGAVWLLVSAFRESVGWGLAVIFLPVLGAILFVFRHARRCVWPLILLGVGGLLVGGTYAYNYFYTQFVDLGPREKTVDGELHITLTGWDEDDYSILEQKPDTVVLQMANADVTDETLKYLRGMSKLQELDLNYTQVSDEGLKTLAGLPALKILRLRKTPVTDEGFRSHLAEKESLLELDARETSIASKTLREWKAKQPDQRKYLK